MMRGWKVGRLEGWRGKALLLAAGLSVFVAGCGTADEAPAPASPTTGGAAMTASFAPVQTLFNKKCLPCHAGPGKEGVNLETYEAVMKGGEMGVVVVAGDPANSILIQALRGLKGKDQMPFKQPPLPEEDIKMVEDWIAAGAKP